MFTITQAQKKDVIHIVAMLADDKLGQLREDFRDPLPDTYYQAFSQIANDPNQELMILEEKGEIIGTFQMSFIPYLTYQGGIRAQVEAVRIRKDKRGGGIGEKVFTWIIERAKARGAHVLQLTTDKKRPDAKRFYEKMGFVDSHEGMKLHFTQG